MDNINDLVGDAAKQLMAQADGIQNPRLKESAKRVALTVSAKTRDETITKARNAAFARIPIWAFFLPVTRRQQIVLGRIYSFQCTTNKDGSPAEYRMSLSTGASELGMTNRAEMQKDLQRLISLGFVTKRSNGTRKPATYLVDEVVCVTEARRNGSVEGAERRVGGSVTGGWFFLAPYGFAGSLRGAVACAPSD